MGFNLSLTVTFLLCPVAAGLGQSRSIARSVFGSGGRCSSTNAVLDGTAGQAVQGQGHAASRDGHWGFWYLRLGPPPDVGITRIDSPAGRVDTAQAVVPKVTIRNFGPAIGPFLARFTILDSGRAVVYQDSASVILISPESETTIAFVRWPGTRNEGRYAACCSLVVSDADPENDTMTAEFTVGSRPPWPAGWHEVASMPSGRSNRPAERGAWLASDQANGLVYAAKGYRTSEFYFYDPVEDSWTGLAPVPEGREGRLFGKGSKAVADGEGHIYAAKGNNTLGFWRYDQPEDTWTQLADVPLGGSQKKVKGGTDLALCERGSTGYVYLLKGYGTEFWRYNIGSRSWELLSPAPTGRSAKWQEGSWLAYDGQSTIYAHKACWHELWAYSLAGDSWSQGELPGMPCTGSSGRRRKSKAGGCGAWYGSSIYALKGGNTDEFWRYDAGSRSWQELDAMPALGSTGRKKKVKTGAGIASIDRGAFFALKGNKTLELWRYVEPLYASRSTPEARDGVSSSVERTAYSVMRISPNPLASGIATLSWGSGVARDASGIVRIYDISGRCVLRQAHCVGRSASSVLLDLRSLSSGIYLLRLDAGDSTVARAAGVASKFIVQR